MSTVVTYGLLLRSLTVSFCFGQMDSKVKTQIVQVIDDMISYRGVEKVFNGKRHTISGLGLNADGSKRDEDLHVLPVLRIFDIMVLGRRS